MIPLGRRTSQATLGRTRPHSRVELMQRTLLVERCSANAGASPGYRSGLEYRSSIEMHGRLTEALAKRFEAEFHLYAEKDREENRDAGALVSSRGNLQFVAHAPPAHFDRILQMALSGRLRRAEFVLKKPRYGSALMISWSLDTSGPPDE